MIFVAPVGQLCIRTPLIKLCRDENMIFLGCGEDCLASMQSAAFDCSNWWSDMIGCVQKIIKPSSPCYDCIEDYLNSTWVVRDSIRIMVDQKMEKSLLGGALPADNTPSKRGIGIYNIFIITLQK